jgi:O-antigen ligase
VAVLVVALLQRRLLQAVVLLTAVAAVSALVFAAPITARVQAQFGTSATASTEVPQTIGYRVRVWQRDFLPLMERAVPYGTGNELPSSVLFQNTENQYISLVLRGGVLLLLSGLAALVLAAAAVFRAARRPTELTGAAAGAALGIVLFLPFASMVWPYVTNAGFPQAWLSLAGAVVGAATIRRFAR